MFAAAARLSVNVECNLFEETFIDDKSNGFELELSHLRDKKKLERLCLVLAIATLFLFAQGVAVVESRQR